MRMTAWSGWRPGGCVLGMRRSRSIRVRDRDLDFRAGGVAGDRGQRWQARRARPQPQARELSEVAGRDGERVHVRGAREHPEVLSGAEAGQGDRRADRETARERAREAREARVGGVGGGAAGARVAVDDDQTREPGAWAGKADRVAAVTADARAPGGIAKERLFANPSRPASFAAGGNLQLRSEAAAISSFQNYFSDILHLSRNQYTLKPLRVGAIVVAGTILGRVAGPSSTTASHLVFMVQPAGKDAPQIDPKPILDGWKLLEATAVYRAAGVDPFYGPGAKNPSTGQVLLMSKQQLTNRILSDPRVQIYACGQRDIQAGLIDRRILAAIEFLSASGLDPPSQASNADTPPTARTASTKPARPDRAWTSQKSTASRSSATKAPARSPTSRSADSSPSKAR